MTAEEKSAAKKYYRTQAAAPSQSMDTETK